MPAGDQLHRLCGDAAVGALCALLPGPAALHGASEGQQSCICSSGQLQQRGGGSGETPGQFCGHDIQCGICIKHPWAAQYNTWLLIKLTPKGVFVSVLLFLHKIPEVSAQQGCRCANVFTDLAKLVLKRANRAVPVALASCDNIEAAQVRVINVCHQVIYQPLIL